MEEPDATDSGESTEAESSSTSEPESSTEPSDDERSSCVWTMKACGVVFVTLITGSSESVAAL